MPGCRGNLLSAEPLADLQSSGRSGAHTRTPLLILLTPSSLSLLLSCNRFCSGGWNASRDHNARLPHADSISQIRCIINKNKTKKKKQNPDLISDSLAHIFKKEKHKKNIENISLTVLENGAFN